MIVSTRMRGLAAVMGIVATIAAPAAADDLKVVASFKPVHSLVAGVMQGVGTPTLLVKGAASPHTYALKPSDAEALQTADVIFWIGDGFELFLSKPLASLPARADIVELDKTDGLLRLAPREGGVWEPDMGEPADGEAHDHGGVDGHLWLDPHNATLMVGAIARALAARDPEHAAAYRRNGEALRTKLEAVDAEVAADLAPVRAVPFIVFHDAYQYLEKRYGLAGVGSLTVGPDQPPGARRLLEIRQKIATQGARCVFREPNFEPALLDTVTAGTPARTGVLDPEGAALVEGPELYFDLLRGLAVSLRACLAASS